MFTEPAKKIARSYYSQKPRMYYAGCSTGGAQGFALAQFHPDVFEGIYAGSPGNYYSHLMLSFLWNGLNSNVSPQRKPKPVRGCVVADRFIPRYQMPS